MHVSTVTVVLVNPPSNFFCGPMKSTGIILEWTQPFSRIPGGVLEARRAASIVNGDLNGEGYQEVEQQANLLAFPAKRSTVEKCGEG
jgi:hypothetical protein